WATRRSRRRPSPKRSRSPRLLRSRKRSPSGSDSEVDPENWTTRDVKLIGVHCSIPMSVMTGTRQRYSAAFKARVALEAAKQTRTLAEEATPGRRRIVLQRRPPRAGPEPGHPDRALSRSTAFPVLSAGAVPDPANVP